MSTGKTNLLWKSFKGIRKQNSVNSPEELAADIALNISLSKEKSGTNRSIKSSGWFNDYITLTENVIRKFPANMSGYSNSNQLLAFTKTASNINVWIVADDSGIITPVQIAQFPIVTDVTDVCTVQFGDRLVTACAFGNNTLGYIAYSATALTGWTQMGTTDWYYRIENIVETTTSAAVTNITSIAPYGSRLAINGKTTYSDTGVESIYGVWFSEAGNPINFASSYMASATLTNPFFVETGEIANKLVEYNGLVAFCKNRTYNVSGTTSDDYRAVTLTSKGVIGNAAFVINGQCAYVDSFADNMFILTNNIDGTIGFDSPIGDDIQDFLKDVENVSINAFERGVRILKETGESLVFDVDIKEWTTETFAANSRCVTFLDRELMCDGTAVIKEITGSRGASSSQKDNADGYFSYYKTNLIWLDSQSSVKSHIYPFAVILEPQTNNDFFIKFTVDRKNVYQTRVTRSGFVNVATYSETDEVPSDGSQFVSDDDDLSGRIFLAATGNDLLVTVDRPPRWRYLQIEIYTTSAEMEFNIAGIEAKQTFITDELLDY